MTILKHVHRKKVLTTTVRRQLLIEKTLYIYTALPLLCICYIHQYMAKSLLNTWINWEYPQKFPLTSNFKYICFLNLFNCTYFKSKLILSGNFIKRLTFKTPTSLCSQTIKLSPSSKTKQNVKKVVLFTCRKVSVVMKLRVWLLGGLMLLWRCTRNFYVLIKAAGTLALNPTNKKIYLI